MNIPTEINTNTLDCGDNSCLFAAKRGGMRTNCGCRCLNGLSQAQRRKLLLRLDEIKSEARLDALREVREMASKRAKRNHSRSVAMRKYKVGHVLYGQTEDTYMAAARENERTVSTIDALIAK